RRLVGVGGEVPLELLPAVLVAPLLHRPLQLPQLPLVRIGWHITLPGMTRRILIATDAWHPQVNGVVRTLDTTARLLCDLGHAVAVVSPDGFPHLPVPFYPEVRVGFPRPGPVADRVRPFRRAHLAMATAGPLGSL